MGKASGLEVEQGCAWSLVMVMRLLTNLTMSPLTRAGL